MSSQGRSARCVFVGNIPYDATEEQLTEVFSEVGPVVSFRLVFDRDTGKPKGYGFCEYRDAETALSAMRNLNNREFNGRQLRVDFAENEKQSMQQQQQHLQQQQQMQRHLKPQPPLPNFSTAPSAPETIHTMLEGLTKAQLQDIVVKMKLIAQQNPEQARQILLTNPPLAYAVLQAQAMLGMINMQTVQKVLSKTQPAMAPAAPIMQPMPGMGILGATPTGIPATGFMPPAMAAPPKAGILGQLDQLPEQQRALVTQLLSLTPEQIEALPPEHRQQIQQLRQTLLGTL